MKPVTLMLLLLAVLPLTACGEGWQLSVSDPSTGQTQALTAQTLGERKLVINYWAEWCKPCREEIPVFNTFAQSHREQVVVVAFDFDRPKQTALHATARKAGIAYSSLITDPSTVFTLPTVEGLPTTLILDSHGKVLKVLPGAQTAQSLEAALSP